jgi:leucyl aminopeptidase
MTDLAQISFVEPDAGALASTPGRITVLMDADGPRDLLARRLNRLMRGTLARLAESQSWQKLKPGEGVDLSWPAGLQAEAVRAVRIPARAGAADLRKAGAGIGQRVSSAGETVLFGNRSRPEDLALGLALRAYSFTDHKSDKGEAPGAVRLMVKDPQAAADAFAPLRAVAEGTFHTRDLVNAPANVLTTTSFAEQLVAMSGLGLKVEVLEEKDLEKLGMLALLAVGQGSDSPTKVVVLRWKGGKKGAAPLALVGKGVMFDTGGISIKPAGGMEEMTMDMGGAAVVAGVMKAIALRKAKANVVGLVGLVENMPDGRAQRPGDIVRSMKGDTIEVINTDAEGRLVLADLLWYAQERFSPAGMIDLATLTGAVIVALGHENAGVFANDDKLADAVLAAAGAEGEGGWRLPLGAAYDTLIKSRLADMKNTGGRPAGSITAAQFLQRFVKPETPWVHLDIAGVALLKSDSTFAPKGATGWGVRTLDRLIRDRFEG